MDFGGFLTVLIGVGFGYFYFWRHKAAIRQLFFNSRLLLDDAHLMYCYELLQNPKYYAYFASQFSFLPQIQHADALHRGRKGAKSSLAAMYRAYGKHLGIMALAYFSLPLLLFLAVQTAGYFLAGAFVTVAVSILYELLLTGGKGNVMNTRLETLLKQAYSYAGYRSASAALVPSPAVPSPQKPSSPTSRQYETYPLLHLANPLETPLKPQPPVTMPLQTTPAAAIFESPDDDEPLSFAAGQGAAARRKLTFNNLWWGVDALFCLGIIVYFWATDARTITDYLLVPFLYILFLQVFFVPTWFVIRIARRLMADN